MRIDLICNKICFFQLLFCKPVAISFSPPRSFSNVRGFLLMVNLCLLIKPLSGLA